MLTNRAAGNANRWPENKSPGDEPGQEMTRVMLLALSGTTSKFAVGRATLGFALALDRAEGGGSGQAQAIDCAVLDGQSYGRGDDFGRIALVLMQVAILWERGLELALVVPLIIILHQHAKASQAAIGQLDDNARGQLRNSPSALDDQSVVLISPIHDDLVSPRVPCAARWIDLLVIADFFEAAAGVEMSGDIAVATSIAQCGSLGVALANPAQAIIFIDQDGHFFATQGGNGLEFGAEIGMPIGEGGIGFVGFLSGEHFIDQVLFHGLDLGLLFGRQVGCHLVISLSVYIIYLTLGFVNRQSPPSFRPTQAPPDTGVRAGEPNR